MELITPSWSAPASIKVVSTTRMGGQSLTPFQSLNMGDHVGDDPAAVAANRRLLQGALGLENIQWLKQVHGTECIQASSEGSTPTADACWSDELHLGCAIMTADCLPVVMTDGQRIAAAHAGWRGLVQGVLETTLACFRNPETVSVWLGPAIGPQAFEVGREVKDAFCDQHAAAASCFVAGDSDKWLADLYALASLRLQYAGVARISGGDYCTCSDAGRFFSYRRDGITGRQVTLIWKV